MAWFSDLDRRESASIEQRIKRERQPCSYGVGTLKGGSMTVTVSFWRDQDDRVKTFIYQDSPQFRNDGAYADLAHHEVLELLSRLGLSQQDSEQLLQLVLQQPPTVRRRQFNLSPDQEAQVRQFFPGPW